MGFMAYMILAPLSRFNLLASAVRIEHQTQLLCRPRLVQVNILQMLVLIEKSTSDVLETQKISFFVYPILAHRHSTTRVLGFELWVKYRLGNLMFALCLFLNKAKGREPQSGQKIDDRALNRNG